MSSPLGCASYNEMIVAADKDLLSAVNDEDAFVCFSETEDSFFLISFDTPSDSLFTKSGDSAPKAWGMILYSSHKNGVSDDVEIVAGDWRKLGVGQNSSKAFQSHEKDKPGATIDDSEILVDFSFENVGGGKTRSAARIRRSTRRFSQTLQWNNPPKTPKGEPNHGSDETTGHCAEFSTS